VQTCVAATTCASSANGRGPRAQLTNNPDWNQGPIIADRLTWEVAKFADPDAIIVHEAGSVALHSFDFTPIGGRELFFYYGVHLDSGVGTAAGVKLARPNQQVMARAAISASRVAS
jgi:thiamine pyrophosphate-dependent acetolactate synthase large subunit-like protein